MTSIVFLSAMLILMNETTVFDAITNDKKEWFGLFTTLLFISSLVTSLMVIWG